VPKVTNIPQPTAAPSALTLWAVLPETQRTAFEKLIAEVSQGIHIQVVVTPKTVDGLQADIRSNILGGLPPPDLIWASQSDLGLLHRSDLLQPAKDGLDMAAFLPATMSGATLDGKRWGTPVAAQSYLLLLYNKKLVTTPPATTDQLISQSRALKVDGRYGLGASWADPLWFAAWLTGFGGTIVNSQGALSLDTPQTIAALNLLKELRVAGPPTPITYDGGAKLFQQGRVAFMLDGEWSLTNYQKYTDTLDLGVAPMPVVPATGQRAVAPLGGVYLMYSKNLVNAPLRQAQELGRALTQPAIQSRIARDLGILPALKTALNDPAVQSNAVLAVAATQSEQALGLPSTQTLRCAWEAIGANLPLVLTGEIAQEAAAQRMQGRATQCAANA
jgi:maltose-binding protein MalE